MELSGNSENACKAKSQEWISWCALAIIVFG